MRSLEVRIVGTITDATQLDEIQDIAKIFVYEHRMKTMKLTPTPPITPSNHDQILHTIYPVTYMHTKNPMNHYIRGFA